MFLASVFFVLTAASFGLVFFIIKRRWRDIALLDPSSLKDEQERQRRESLILRRFERMRGERARPWKQFGRALGASLERFQERLQNHVRSVEAMYESAKRPFTSLTPSTRERIHGLLSEAKSLTRDLKWSEAERRYLEVLTLDRHHAEAYRGLGQMYLKQRVYPQAKETFEFLLKINKADDATYAGLAEVVEADGQLEEALSLRQKAIAVHPRQACRYAELAEFYLRQGDGKGANEAAEKAVKREPTSTKYLELLLEAAILLRDREQANKVSDRLRLVASDSTRFRTWKDKIEKISSTP